MNLIYCQMRRRWDLVTDNFLAAAQKFPRPRLAMPRCCSAHAPSFKSHSSHATMLRSKAFMLPRGSLRRRWDLVTDNFLAAAQKFPRPRLAMPRCCSAHAPSFKSHSSHATMLRSKAFMLPRGLLRRRWDLNPRGTFAPAGFRNRCLQPLSHSS